MFKKFILLALITYTISNFGACNQEQNLVKLVEALLHAKTLMNNNKNTPKNAKNQLNKLINQTNKRLQTCIKK